MYEIIINGKTKLVDEKRLNLIKIVYGKNVEIQKEEVGEEPQKIVKTKKKKNGSL